MSKQHAHLNHAVKVIETAKPGEPLSLHLKKYFAASSKFGSGDRRMISKLCYYYYRVASAYTHHSPPATHNLDIPYIIIRGFFLIEKEHSDFLQTHHPDLDQRITMPVAEKFALLKMSPENLFPFSAELSPEIDKEQFFISLLVQPLVYIRIRPGHTLQVIEHLGEKKIDYVEASTSCIGLEPGTNVDALFKVNKDVVIQDRSSQQVFRALQADDMYLPNHPAIWDCCAAAGGKSMLIYDLLHGDCRLTVSDKRDRILKNLKERFHEAGIENYKWFTRDLVSDGSLESHEKFDVIICDVPCSGSATWARTPEQMHNFPATKIDEYQTLQRAVLAAALPALNAGGVLFYITCSVFKKENEDNVDFIISSTNLQHLESTYIKGYDKRADTMFVGVFRN